MPLFAEKMDDPVRRLANGVATGKVPVFPEKNAVFGSA
jgi:hypothetical protein